MAHTLITIPNKAGLFSGINTAFLIEAYKDLKADPSEVTNDILRLVFNKLGDSNVTLPENSFVAPSRAVRVNCFFLASLSCSLMTALGAVLGKQWLAYYDQENRLRPASERGRDRHRKYLGAKTWHLKAVIETLPTLLQLSFFLFFAAQIDLFWFIHKTVASVILFFAIVTFTFYIITTLIAIFAFGSPFQTRLSAVLIRIKLRITNQYDKEDEEDVIGAQCVNWLLETTTLPDALVASVKAVAKLSEKAREGIGFDVKKIMKLVFKPVALGTKVQLGISTESLRLSLPGLVGLLHLAEGFSWHNILPEVDVTNITLSLQDALLKVYRSRTSNIELDRWIGGFFATLHLESSDIATEFDRLYTTLLHNLPSISSSARPYDDLATICLLVKDSAPASLVADILNVPFTSLKQRITSSSLDAFFVVPTVPEGSLRVAHQSPMQLIMHQDTPNEFHTILPSDKLSHIKASLCGAILKAFQSKTSDLKLGRWIAGYFAPLYRESSDTPTGLDVVYTALLHSLPSFSSSTSHQPYADLATICLLINDSVPSALIAEAVGVEFNSLHQHLTTLALDAFFVVPTKPEEPLRLLHQSPMRLVEGKDVVFDISEHVKKSNTPILRGYLEHMTSELERDVAPTIAALGLPQESRLSRQDNPWPTLQFCCLHWSAHLDFPLAEDVILPLITPLLEKHLLRWLEVLSSCEQLELAGPSLKRAQDWLTVSRGLVVFNIHT